MNKYGKKTRDIDIDIVYNYVNSKDIGWIKRRREYTVNDSNSNCRFRDNNELLFSLRSIEKYAPWIRKVFILMDSKAPDWLDISNSKICIIEHSEFMPKEILPCYNSTVIESFLDKIPGLSDIFLYANDDMFLGGFVSKDFFVKDNKPIVRLKKENISPEEGYYERVLCNSQQLIKNRFGIKYELTPIHNIDIYSKEGIRECKEMFFDEFRKASHNRLRKDDDIHRVIFHYYMIYNDMCVLKAYENDSPKYIDIIKKTILHNTYLDFIFYRLEVFFASKRAKLYFAFNPKLVCLNDSEITSEEDLKKYRNLMKKKFPQKSMFEV